MDENIVETESYVEEVVPTSEEVDMDFQESEVLSESETESDSFQIDNEDIETIVTYINTVSGNNVSESDFINYDELIYNYLTDNSVLNPTPVIEENFFTKDFSDYDSTQVIGVSTIFLILVFLVVYIIKE